MTDSVSQIDELCWNAARYSAVLKMDVRLVSRALESIPCRTFGKRRVWHVSDGMPAIFRHIHRVSDDPDEIPKHPRDRLDHYRAERERLKLEQEQRFLLSAAEVESAISALIKALAQSLETLPAQMERDYNLPADQVSRLHEALDAAREALYTVAIDSIHAQSAAE